MFKIYKNFEKKDWARLFIGIIFIVLGVLLELKMPDYMSKITTLVETPNSQMSEIIKNGFYMLLCALGSMTISIITGFLYTGMSANLSKNVRKKIFNKVEDLAIHDVKEFSVGSLITRTTNDVTQIQMFTAMGMQMIIRAPIMAGVAISKIIGKSWEWSLATTIGVVITLLFVGLVMILVVPKFKIVQKLTDRLNEVSRESLTGIRVVRAFNAEKYQEDKFKNVNDNLTKVQTFNQRFLFMMDPIITLVMDLVTLSIYLIGANLINAAAIANKLVIFSDMIVFSTYAVQIIMSFLIVSFILMILPRASVSASRINEVLDKDIDIKDGDINKDNFEENRKEDLGTVEFKNVNFKYPDAEEYLLQDINFKVEKGQTVAFIGPTGSGKSTLINLIPRLYDATDGEVLVDGINVKRYNQEYLHTKIGYAAQKAVMFDDTVKGNISFGDSGKEITEKDVEEAVSVAEAKDFVEKMDDKYDSHLSSGGTNISGGQKQRISIARAIARKPEIFIFDDTFSALDYKTDAILRQNLKNKESGITTLIVAQRIGTIMNADKIYVIDDGKIVGEGTHKELMKNCKEYKEIALSQLSEKELA